VASANFTNATPEFDGYLTVTKETTTANSTAYLYADGLTFTNSGSVHTLGLGRRPPSSYGFQIQVSQNGSSDPGNFDIVTDSGQVEIYDADGVGNAVLTVSGDIKTTSGGDLTVDGALNHDGSTVGFFGTTPASRPTGYTTFSNLSSDRTCDANSTTTDELADILGTLIEDLKSLGLIAAS
jgi:hypothetical protein